MNRKIPVILDVDTGVDDAIALLYACASDKLDILGAVAVSGNVGLEHTLRNTLNVLERLGRGDIPVAKGAARAIARDGIKASLVHGLGGLRGMEFKQNATAALSKSDAPEFYRDILFASDQKVTVIALGPVTNLAILFQKYPEVKAKIERIIFMGASYRLGNPTEVATFNVLVDPEAFREVIHSGIPFYAVSLDCCRAASFTAEEVAELGAMEGPGAEFFRALTSGYGAPSREELDRLRGDPNEEIHDETRRKLHADKKMIPDLTTVIYATDPELFTVHRTYCDVECSGELTTGFTLIDLVDYHHKPDSEKTFYYVERVDIDRHHELVREAIASYNKWARKSKCLTAGGGSIDRDKNKRRRAI